MRNQRETRAFIYPRNIPAYTVITVDLSWSYCKHNYCFNRFLIAHRGQTSKDCPTRVNTVHAWVILILSRMSVEVIRFNVKHPVNNQNGPIRLL